MHALCFRYLPFYSQFRLNCNFVAFAYVLFHYFHRHYDENAESCHWDLVVHVIGIFQLTSIDAPTTILLTELSMFAVVRCADKTLCIVIQLCTVSYCHAVAIFLATPSPTHTNNDTKKSNRHEYYPIM